MTDMVEWLEEQLSEDERIARAADGLRWESAGDDPGEGGLYSTDYGFVLAWFELGTANPTGPGHLPRWPTFERHGMANSIHAAAHDPARVLAEIESKRAIITEWRAHEARVTLALKMGLRWDPANERATAVYRVLRLLTAPYRDRPGYREEWVL